jgi:hypothetical protein
MGVAHPHDRDEATLDLVREAIEETRELVRVEVALARRDAAHELSAARAGTAKLWLGASGLVAGATLLLVAVAAAFATLWLAALLIGVIVLVGSGPLVWLGWSALPKRPMAPTAARVKRVKEDLGKLGGPTS